ncbi:glutaminyl-peptide cyclotransferase [Streptomyces sp. ISL-44]|uniref:glutaminyl-peptide cyclotransferase n=1 Tax=Streptomyces sp. ISL-44 TaxID=2819184 RepID=UPI001BE580AF|nr:glutaminyl-peptide cyclotransferase [Streptomyces sp. ISL-44]MBT2544951.1 glutaminyl-peptide cyclotransferase [Streptomyces sp. ISL-44]
MRALLLVPAAVTMLLLGSIPGMAGAEVVGSELSSSVGSGRAAAERMRVEVLDVLPHDPKAFTQGLEMHAGRLYESTGIHGQSSVRAGLPGEAPAVWTRLEESLFGEGITVMGRTLWQLTWRNGVAIERDSQTLGELRRLPYTGEGWGICYQRHRQRLVTSDGSARLTFRDPESLKEIGGITVTDEGRPVTLLNELECVHDTVYANVWNTDGIAKIDTTTGRVTATVDAAGILTTDQHVDVLNGIAAVPGTDQFLITGKYWPTMFRVRFVPSRAGRTVR